MPIPGVGFQEVVIILIAALMIFGPAKLPELMGQAGKALRDFRKMSGNLQGEFEKNLNEAAGTDVRKTLSSEIAGLKNEVQSATASVNGKPAAKTTTARPATTATKAATPAAGKTATTTGAVKKAVGTVGSATTAPASAAKLPAAKPAEPEPTGEIEFVPVRTTSRRGTATTASRPAATATAARPAAASNGTGGSTAVASRPAASAAPTSSDSDPTDPFARARTRRQTAGYHR